MVNSGSHWQCEENKIRTLVHYIHTKTIIDYHRLLCNRILYGLTMSNAASKVVLASVERSESDSSTTSLTVALILHSDSPLTCLP
jgi:hypothetical protein